MRLLLVGPPGSGKGTQAQLLSERQGLEHIGTGDLLRQAIRDKTPAGKRAQSYVERGELVPDDIVNQMVAEHFRSPQAPDNYVMDGYPRNREQAVVFDELINELSLGLNAVIELQMDDTALIRRLAGRLICPKCKAVYHETSNTPKQEGICDNDGTPLLHRKDDNEETIRNRLEIYHQNIADLLKYYKDQGKLIRIDADKDIEEVFQTLLNALQSKKQTI